MLDHEVPANKIAAVANVGSYDLRQTAEYTEGAPHIKHAELWALYMKLVVQVYDRACRCVSQPKVLDIGAGEGSTTLAFLELGAKTTAVDISHSQLEVLKRRCNSFADNLTVYCGDVHDAIEDFLAQQAQYDIVVANSFLHHVPDYIGLIEQCCKLLSPHGQFFSFQDPIKYASLGKFSNLFAKTAYFSWRIFQGDVIGGMRRRVRRSRGVYFDDCPQDNAEYHVVRVGVDQEVIAELLRGIGFDCQTVLYFSTQSRFWQLVGSAIKAYNTFSIIAARKSSDASTH